MDEPKISNKLKTHCKRGHPLSGDNLRVTKNARICKQCNRDRVRNWYIAKGNWNPHRKSRKKE